MNDEIDPLEEIDVTSLLCDLKGIRENSCAGCGAAVCGHEALKRDLGWTPAVKIREGARMTGDWYRRHRWI